MPDHPLGPATIGDVFGKLTVQRQLKSPERTMYMCDCECGETEIVASLTYLRAGRITSCGCGNTLKRRESKFEIVNGLRVVREAAPTIRLQKNGKYEQKVRRVEVKCVACGTSKTAFLSNFRSGRAKCTAC
jgi:hypothetical protein